MEEKFEKLSKYKIKLIKRQDEQAWRLWLNREDEYNFLFMCEKKTINDCLDCAIDFIKTQE